MRPSLLAPPFCIAIKSATLIVLIFSSNAFGQLKVDLVKMHINYNRLDTNGHTIGNIAPAVVLRNRKNLLHELELNELKQTRSLHASYYDQYYQQRVYYKHRSFAIGLRYQFTKNLVKKTDSKFLPQLGLSFLPSYGSVCTDLDDPGMFKRKSRFFRAHFGVVPQIRAHVWRKIYFDLGFPLTIFSYELAYQKVSPKNLNLRSQTNGEVKLTLEGQLSL
jgi:hypothetical protein